MTLLEDIVAYLATKNLVEGDGVDAFRDFQPESPDNIVSLHEYSGDPVSPYTEVVHRSVQVVVRNKSASASKAKAYDLLDAFRMSDGAQRIDFSPTRWGQVHIRQTPFKLKQDDNGRIHYAFNLGITTNTD